MGRSGDVFVWCGWWVCGASEEAVLFFGPTICVYSRRGYVRVTSPCYVCFWDFWVTKSTGTALQRADLLSSGERHARRPSTSCTDEQQHKKTATTYKGQSRISPKPEHQFIKKQHNIK